jgi:hypothetical protein
MGLTLNQVVQRVSLIAKGHKQINFYAHGDIVDILSEEDTIYPACITDMLSPYISPTDREVGFPFTFWIADLADTATDSRRNELDVTSDLMQISEDVIAQLQDPQFFQDFTIDGSFTCEVLREKFRDIVIAVRFDVIIKTRYDSNRCQVPSTFIPPTPIPTPSPDAMSERIDFTSSTAVQIVDFTLNNRSAIYTVPLFQAYNVVGGTESLINGFSVVLERSGGLIVSATLDGLFGDGYIILINK